MGLALSGIVSGAQPPPEPPDLAGLASLGRSLLARARAPVCLFPFVNRFCAAPRPPSCPAAQSQLRQQQYEPVEINNVKDRGQLASLSDLTQAPLAMWVTGVELPEQGAEPGPAPQQSDHRPRAHRARPPPAGAQVEGPCRELAGRSL